jgi:hypothetical protein
MRTFKIFYNWCSKTIFNYSWGFTWSWSSLPHSRQHTWQWKTVPQAWNRKIYSFFFTNTLLSTRVQWGWNFEILQTDLNCGDDSKIKLLNMFFLTISAKMAFLVLKKVRSSLYCKRSDFFLLFFLRWFQKCKLTLVTKCILLKLFPKKIFEKTLSL